KDVHVLRSEVMNLLEKGAVEVVYPAQSESGFYSRYFLVPKKDGGLLLNRALMKRPRSSFKIGASLSPPQNVSKDARPYGLSILSAKIRPALYAAPSVLAETTGSISCVAVDQACVEALIPWKNSQWMERGVPLGMVCRRKVVTTDASNTGWGALCDGKPAFCLWTKAEAGIHINCLEMLAVCRALHFFLPDLKGHHAVVRSDSMTVVSYINRQGGLFSKRLFTLVKDLLEWAQLNLCSLRATHVPGRLNQGADMLSRSQRPLWGVDASSADGPEDLEGLWQGGDNSHCPMYYSKDRDALAQLPPLCFSPDILDSSSTQASQGTETQAPSGGPSLEEPALVLRAEPAARSSPLAHSPETRPPLSSERDNMAPPAQAVGPAPLVSGRESMNLSESVLSTISQARAPSTRRLNALKWSVFSTWCSTRGEDPASCDILVILSFLQELLDKGCSPSMLKVYVAAITASHAPIAGQSVGRNNLVEVEPSSALKGPPFEPLTSSDLQPLTFKAALLLALASVKRMGDLQALSFGPGDSKVILKPRHGYVPKVPSTPFWAQVITLSALPSSEEDQEQSEQLFVCFGGRNKGCPVTKQRLSRWIVDAITLAYSSLGLQCPIGKFVRRPAEPRRPPPLGSTTWTSPPYRRVSFLHNGASPVH
ncbi:hypothetical protein M9458_017840, partial [Cirrhinus mrigala]